MALRLSISGAEPPARSFSNIAFTGTSSDSGQSLMVTLPAATSSRSLSRERSRERNGGICQPKDLMGRQSRSGAIASNAFATAGEALSRRPRMRSVPRQTRTKR